MTQYRYTTEVLRSPRMRWDGTRDGEEARGNLRIEEKTKADQNATVRLARTTTLVLRQPFKCTECGCEVYCKNHGFEECDWCKGYGRRIKG